MSHEASHATPHRPLHETGRTTIDLRLLDTPYSQVASAFEGFADAFNERGTRGGYEIPMPHKPITGDNPYHTHNTRGTSPTYHRETSFSPEQRPYVGITIAALTILARGEYRSTGGETGPPPPRFSERIDKYLQEQDPDAKVNFELAFDYALLDLLQDFGRQYPNLTPALSAILHAGGFQGLAVTSTHAWIRFYKLFEGDPPPTDDIRKKLGSIAQPADFVGAHVVGEQVEYDVYCSGRALATALLKQADYSITTFMAANSNRLDELKKQFDSGIPVGLNDLNDRISSLVQAMTQHAREAYERGEQF